MSTELQHGDRVSFVQNGRKLRGVVGETMNLKAHGEKLLVPVTRPQNRKTTTVKADDKPTKVKVRWIERHLLRKLPS